ncbi:MAG TPA: hypothetical protein VEN81_04455 [Planctomycetota bacterium]|nr:hypothetical protein [Planctomycetota bacterium]
MAVRASLIALLLFAPSGATAAQQRPPGPPARLDEAKVEAALKRGVAWLQDTPLTRGRGNQARELVLLALLHSGVRPSDPTFFGMLRDMLDEDLVSTYRVSLQAMVLEELDRVKYQKRIFQCAQFLVDNQSANGMWSYGQPTTYPEFTVGMAKDLATGPMTVQPGQVVMFGEADPGEKPAVRHKVPVKRQKTQPSGGDNSNSQYALLGLRACHDSGIILPREVLEKAQKWWKESQCDPKGSTGSGRGWSYTGHAGGSYGSMTAGAVGALTICDYILGIDWKKDDTLSSGLTWLGDNFSVTENPGRGHGHLYYYLYGLERAGMLYGTETFGKHAWYPEGAQYLLDTQAADGQWNGPIDTCFAILFLRRATRSLVESKDTVRPKK